MYRYYDSIYGNNFQNITDSYTQKSIVIYTKIVRIDKVCNVPTCIFFFLNVKQYLVNVLFIDLIYESICSTIYTGIGNTKPTIFSQSNMKANTWVLISAINVYTE